MLTLSFKKNDEILVGNNGKIIVADIKKGSIRLRFDFPSDTIIMREYLVKKNTKEGDKK